MIHLSRRDVVALHINLVSGLRRDTMRFFFVLMALALCVGAQAEGFLGRRNLLQGAFEA